MLPGKLCIGILEEDNPLKSYFRLKPLLIEKDGRYEAVDAASVYAEDGCVRIVPDKNESGHFKLRMRRMGRFCVLDLREHAGENNKIRPNKNYRIDENERNANIVYSDVVREPADDMIFEILENLIEGDVPKIRPDTTGVVAADENVIWSREEREDGSCFFARSERVLEEDKSQRFELKGFGDEILRFAIRLPGCMESVTGTPKSDFRSFESVEPATRMPLPARALEKLKGVETVPEPVAPVRPAKPVEAPKPVVAAAPAEPVKPVEPPKPVEAPKAPAQADKQEEPAKAAKPAPGEQTLSAQCGLNPRRSRSLQEIIDDKWRHSRVDQLGHPVPGEAMGTPVESPVDRAVDALKEAWRIPEIRAQLIEALGREEELYASLRRGSESAAQRALTEELNDLEAERLKAMDDLEKLRREKKTLRETFKREIREEEAAAFREATEKTRLAKAECEKAQAEAEALRGDADALRDALSALEDGRFEARLREFAVTSHAARLLREEKPAQEMPVAGEAPDRAAWIDRVRAAFAAEGLCIDETGAANLLICASLCESLLLSGSASSDKDAVARALGNALGAVSGGRYYEITNSPHRPTRNKADAAGNVLGVTVVRDANACPGLNLNAGSSAANRLTIALLRDNPGGAPVPAEAFERGFTVRLDCASADSAWALPEREDVRFAPVAPDALKKAFAAKDEVIPPALDRRLQKLRDALARHDVLISRSSLMLMRRYCASMIALNRVSPGEALDLAFTQKALPCILAEAPIECLKELKEILSGMPHALSLLDKPLPIEI